MTEQLNKLTVLDEASKLLAEIKTVDDARHLMGRAEAARAYAKEIKMGFDVQNTAAEIKIRAQREAGRVLDEMKKRGELYDAQDQSRFNGIQNSRSTGVYFLDDLNITKHDSEQWQFFYRMPNHVFEEGIELSWQPDESGRQRELTTWGMFSWGKSYGKAPAQEKRQLTNATAFKEIQKRLLEVNDNINFIKASSNNGGGKEARHYLQAVDRLLIDLHNDLVRSGFGYEPAPEITA